MNRTRGAHILLAIAFAVGQLCAVLHATQHELSGGDRLVACEVCAVGHAATPPPSIPAVALSLLPAIEAPALRPAAAPRSCPFLRPPPRGPPSQLA